MPRNLPDPIDCQSRLASAVIRIELEKNLSEMWDYATASFITPGIALTAGTIWNPLPRRVASRGD